MFFALVEGCTQRYYGASSGSVLAPIMNWANYVATGRERTWTSLVKGKTPHTVISGLSIS